MRKGTGKFQNRSKYGANRGISTVWDLGRLRPVEGEQPVDEKGDVVQRVDAPPEPTTLAGFIAREETRLRHEQELAAQKLRDAAEHDARVREYWSQIIAELMSSPVGVRDNYSGLETGQSVPNSGQAFIEQLENEGITLTLSAKMRIGKYLESQNLHLGAAVTVANLRRAFERLKALGCFAPGEVTEPSVEPVQTPVYTGPTLGELFARANDSPQADRELRYVIGGMVNAEIREVIEAWQWSVYDNFDHKLTETQIKEAWRFIQDHNLNPLKPASWDAARRSLVTRSLLNDACLTCREVLERQYRDGSINHREFLQRCNTLSIDGVLDKPRRYAAA